MSISLRRTSPALLIAVTMAVLSIFGSPEVKAKRCGGLGWRDRVGSWTRIQAPMEVRSFAVDPRHPSVMYVAGSETVMRSVDGGCSWSNIFRSDPMREVVDVVVTEAQKKAAIYALLSAPPLWVAYYAGAPARIERPFPGPVVAFSRDLGKSWEERNQGLPRMGRAVLLRVAPNDPKRLYLVVSLGQYATAGSLGHQDSVERSALYSSDDGGKTWTLAADPMVSQTASVFDLVIDPVAPRSLWASTSEGLAHSDDGGRSWASVDDLGEAKVEAVSVARSRGAPARVAAFRGGSMFLSENNGKTWKKYPATDFYEVRAATIPPGSLGPIVSSETQVFRFDSEKRRWLDITPRLKAERSRLPDTYLCDFSATRVEPSVYTCTSSTLLRYEGLSR